MPPVSSAWAGPASEHQSRDGRGVEGLAAGSSLLLPKMPAITSLMHCGSHSLRFNHYRCCCNSGRTRPQVALAGSSLLPGGALNQSNRAGSGLSPRYWAISGGGTRDSEAEMPRSESGRTRFAAGRQ
jgi:hypothetical protein